MAPAPISASSGWGPNTRKSRAMWVRSPGGGNRRASRSIIAAAIPAPQPGEAPRHRSGRFRGVCSPDEEQRPMLYFAYGSDLDPEEMKVCCPGHAVVGLAVLHDHRLA